MVVSGSVGRDRVGGRKKALYAVYHTVCRFVGIISIQLISSTLFCHYSKMVICQKSMALWEGGWLLTNVFHCLDFLCYPELIVGALYRLLGIIMHFLFSIILGTLQLRNKYKFSSLHLCLFIYL